VLFIYRLNFIVNLYINATT